MNLKFLGGVYLSKLMLMAISFATNVIVARFLGPEGVGKFALAMTNGVLMGSVISLGLESALLYFSSKKSTLLPYLSVFSFFYVVFVISFIVGFKCIFGFKFIYSDFLNNQSLLIMAVYMLQSYFISIKIGEGMLAKINLWLIILNILYMGLLIFYGLFGKLTPGSVVAIYVAIFGAFGTLGLFSGWMSEKTITEKIKISEIFSYAFRSLMGTWAGMFRLRLPIILVSIYAVSADVGIYSVSQTFMEAFFILPVILSTMLLPILSALPSEERAKTVVNYARFSLYSTLLILSFFLVFANLIIKLTYGNMFYEAINVSRVLCIGVVFFAVSKVLMSYFMSIGRPGVVSLLELFALFCFVLFYLMLAPKNGLWGIVATVVLSLFFMLIATLIVFKIFTQVKVRKILMIQGSDVAFLNKFMRVKK